MKKIVLVLLILALNCTLQGSNDLQHSKELISSLHQEQLLVFKHYSQLRTLNIKNDFFHTIKDADAYKSKRDTEYQRIQPYTLVKKRTSATISTMLEALPSFAHPNKYQALEESDN